MRFRLHRLSIWCVLAAMAAGCGLPRNQKAISQCVLPQDQVRTFLGKWAVTPIPMAVFQAPNDELSSDKTLVAESLDVWNRFTSSSFGFAMLGYRTATGDVSVHTVSPVDRSAICDYSILSNDGKSFVQPVMIHKRSPWPYDSQIVALTTSCSFAGTSTFKVAMIELNVADWFAPGKPQPDVKSILVHEVGHMLGLGHSCEFPSGTSEDRPGVPDCNSRNLNKAYTTAVMYPTFNVPESGPAEVRSKLNSNDMGRANCLYK